MAKPMRSPTLSGLRAAMINAWCQGDP